MPVAQEGREAEAVQRTRARDLHCVSLASLANHKTERAEPEVPRFLARTEKMEDGRHLELGHLPGSVGRAGHS